MAYHPFRNLGLKFLSTLVAFLLWLIVAGERVVERVMRAPVEFQNLPAGLELVGSPPDTVEVRLRGSSGALSRMAAGDMSAVIDLATARPGRRLFHITQSQVNVPYGIDIVRKAGSGMSWISKTTDAPSTIGLSRLSVMDIAGTLRATSSGNSRAVSG